MSLFEPSDRRRILAACITTLALAPLLLGSRGGTPGGDGNLAAIGQGDLAAALAAGDSSSPHADPAAVPDAGVASEGGPGYLIGPPPATEPTVVRIAVPPTSRGNAIQSTATFRRWEAGRTSSRPCAVQDVPTGITVTVTSLQNGQSITCMVVGQPRPGDRAPVVLDVNLFAQLADLIEQPIPVRVTW